MKTVRLLIDLTYDDKLLYGNDPDGIRWFEEEVLGSKNLTLFERGELDDDVGEVKIVARCTPDM